MLQHPVSWRPSAALAGCLLGLMILTGCPAAPSKPVAERVGEVDNGAVDSGEVDSDETDATQSDSVAADDPQAADASPLVFELAADALLAARLPAEQSEAGWVRLFDGQSLFGWQIVQSANWRVEDGAIVVDAGEKSFLATSSAWDNYELELEFQADSQTNSGIFLRTPLDPASPARDCYELNIAPADNAFPTGSLVERKRVEPSEIEPFDASNWHRYRVRVEDQVVTVHLDDKEICRYEDKERLPAGRISLQHNEGRVAFRDIRVRPLGLESLLATKDLSQWKQYPEYEGEFTVDDQGQLNIIGGSGQLESRRQFGDFALLARCRTNAPELNSGIFFRCIPGEKMNGYECQISNAMVDGNPLMPVDHGTGGIFRRQPARIVAAEDESWFTLLLVARGPNMMAWVNGLQVSDWTDTREPDPNPRRGLRLEPGTLMLQAHDATTDLSFSDISVVSLGDEPEPAWPAEASSAAER